VMEREADLLEIVPALSSSGCFSSLLDGRQQQCDQDCDDGDHDEQLDQRKTLAGREGTSHCLLHKKGLPQEGTVWLAAPGTSLHAPQDVASRNRFKLSAGWRRLS